MWKDGNKSIIFLLFGLLSTVVISFGNEVASYTFSFAQINYVSMYNVSLLVASIFLGSIVVTPFTVYLCNRLNLIVILQLAFIIAASVILLASISNNYYIFCIVSLVLGATTSVFWSVIDILVPSIFHKNRLIDINKILHAIRDSGYLLAPILTGVLDAKLGVRYTLIVIAVCFIVAIIVFIMPLYYISNKFTLAPRSTVAVSKLFMPQVGVFLAISGMKSTLIPRLITICASSVFHVALMYQILVNLGYSKTEYGIILSAASVGLVVGPVALASLFKKTNIAISACLCAIVIGLCISLTGLSHSVIILYMVLLILGVANGLQNTLLSTFVMTAVPSEQRNMLMPTYTFIVRLFILLGFVVSAQIAVSNAYILLIVAGSVTCLCGIAGVLSNYYSVRSAG